MKIRDLNERGVSREVRAARISSEFYLGLSLLLAVVSHADQVGHEKILSIYRSSLWVFSQVLKGVLLNTSERVMLLKSALSNSHQQGLFFLLN